MTPLKREEMRDLLSKRDKMHKNSDEKGELAKWVVRRTVVNVHRRVGAHSQDVAAGEGQE